MSNRIQFDTSQVDRLAVDLSEAPGRIQRRAPKVFEVGANKIKKGMRAEASGHRHLRGLPQHVNYTKFSALDFEIGIDKGGQGSLGNFAAFGSVNNVRVMDHTAPLRHELPFIQRNLVDAGADAVLGEKDER